MNLESFNRLRRVVQPLKHLFGVKHVKRVLVVPELHQLNARVNMLSLHNGKLLIGSNDLENLFTYDVLSLDVIKTVNAACKLSQAFHTPSGNIVCTPQGSDKVLVISPENGKIVKETKMQYPHLFCRSYDNVLYLQTGNWVRMSADNGMTWPNFFKVPDEVVFDQLVKVHDDNIAVFWGIDSEAHMREYKTTLPNYNSASEQKDENVDRQVTWLDMKLLVPTNAWPVDLLIGKDQVLPNDATLSCDGGGFVVVTHHYNKERVASVYLFSVRENAFERVILDSGNHVSATAVAIDVKRKLLCLGSYSGHVFIYHLDYWHDPG